MLFKLTEDEWGESYNVSFLDNISFNENLKALGFENIYLYDLDEKRFIDLNIVVSSYNFEKGKTLRILKKCYID